MAQKLWEKSVQVDRDVERFTVGKDREMDLYLAPFDILGSLAHISMLQSIGLLTAEELKQLTEELRNIYRDTETGKFLIEEGVEDVHSQVELLLTRTSQKKSIADAPVTIKYWSTSNSSPVLACRIS